MAGAYVRPTRRPTVQFHAYLSGDEVTPMKVARLLAVGGVNATVQESIGVWKGGRESGCVVFFTETTHEEVVAALGLLSPLGIEEVLLMESAALMSHVAI